MSKWLTLITLSSINMVYQSKKYTISGLELSFEQITKSEIDALTDLFNQARNRKIPYSFFQNKYDTKYTGIENCAIVIKNQDEKIIGHLGVLPIPLLFKDQTYLSGQISDAVLDPVLRGKNVFELLIQEVEELSNCLGIPFLWVSPSPQAVNGFDKRSWIETNKLTFHLFHVSSFPINKIANKFSLHFLYRPYIKMILRLLTRRKLEMENSNFMIGRGGVLISKTYVVKKNYTLNHLVEKNGFTLWFKIGDGLEINNVEYFAADKYKEFIKTCVQLSKILGCHQFKFITSESTFLDSVIKQSNREIGNKIYFKGLSTSLEFDKILFNGSDFNTF
jgi:hypothetical protein